GLAMLFPELPGDLNSIHLWHGDVQDNHVRLEVQCRFQCGSAVRNRANKIERFGQQGSDCTRHRAEIVSHQYSRSRHESSFLSFSSVSDGKKASRASWV